MDFIYGGILENIKRSLLLAKNANFVISNDEEISKCQNILIRTSAFEIVNVVSIEAREHAKKSFLN